MNEDGKNRGVEQPGHPHNQYPYGTFQGVANYYQPPPHAPPHPVVGFPRPIAPPFASSTVNPHYFPPAYQAIPVGYNVIEERGYERESRLPCCGIGMGWFLFMAGFVLGGVPWYVGTLVLLITHVDYREKPGYVACTIAVAIMGGGARVVLNGWQRAVVSAGSAVGALLDPRRADLIAALGETTGKPAFERVLERMKRSAEGRAILLERPRVISTQVGHAWDLPDNTFGAAYAKFMGSRNFSPDDRPPVRFMDTDELAYVAMRAREVHDFWHTLFGLHTNLIGESALKAIEFQQMYLPMCLMSIVGGTARFSEKQRRLFFQHYFPWAVRAGMQATDLMCVYYEKHLHEDLEDVRRKWGVIPAPAAPK